MKVNGPCENCVFKKTPLSGNCKEEIQNNPLTGKRIYKVRKGKAIVKQGMEYKGVFCIRGGNVKVVWLQDNEEAFFLWNAEKGQIIGIDAFINGTDYSSTFIAEEPCEVCFIPDDEFQALLYKNPLASLELMRIIGTKINFIEDRLTSIACKKSNSRLVEQLLCIAMANNKAGKNSVEFNYDVDELAHVISTTKNYLYKLLAKLSRKGIIEMDMQKISVPDMEKLYNEISGGHKIDRKKGKAEKVIY